MIYFKIATKLFSVENNTYVIKPRTPKRFLLAVSFSAERSIICTFLCALLGCNKPKINKADNKQTNTHLNKQTNSSFIGGIPSWLRGNSVSWSDFFLGGFLSCCWISSCQVILRLFSCSFPYFSFFDDNEQWWIGSMYVSGKLPTYPSPNLTFCPKREVSVNVRFGDG